MATNSATLTLDRPALSEQVGEHAKNRQRQESALLAARILLLLVAAAGGLFVIIVDRDGTKLDVGGIVVVIAFFGSSAIGRWSSEIDPEKSSEKLYAALRVMDSAIWRYAACAQPTSRALDDEVAAAVYVGRLQEIGDQIFARGAPTGPLVTESMHEVRDSDLANRKNLYLTERLDKAHSEALRDALRSARSATIWKVIAVTIELLGIGGGILKATSLTSVDILGFAGVSVASIAVWLESRGFDNTASTAAAKTELLAAAKEASNHVDGEERWSAFATEVEDKLTLDATATLGRISGHQYRAALQADSRQMSPERYFAAVAELKNKLNNPDKGQKKFEPDVVVGVNPGGAIVGGILYFTMRAFRFAPVSLRAGFSREQVKTILTWTLSQPPRNTGVLRVLVVDASMKSGDSLMDVVSVLEEIRDQSALSTLSGIQVEFRTAIIAYRPDLSTTAQSGLAPDYFIDTSTESFPYGRV